MSDITITGEQFAEWKNDPVTKEVFAGIKQMSENLEEKLKNGLTIGETADVTHGLTNRMLGHLDGLNQLLNISFANEKIDTEVNEVSGY